MKPFFKIPPLPSPKRLPSARLLEAGLRAGRQPPFACLWQDKKAKGRRKVSPFCPPGQRPLWVGDQRGMKGD
ncbi:MAG: hypothetical protein A2V86_09055 [Deltaproteobacteria bacterium RBG_16_49_23]|nr:MAG: hypothetical protein A2V86_09055 [Deltaproteobacteria bacterium RBG_16_49_23]